MKTLNLRKGQRTKQRNRILVDLISKIWDTKNWKQKNWPYGWIELLYTIEEKQSVYNSWIELLYTIVQSNRTVSFSVFQFYVTLSMLS